MKNLNFRSVVDSIDQKELAKFRKSGRGIQATSELNRILHLPRRGWSKEELGELASQMTEALKRPEGTMRLRPVQAYALYDLARMKGLFSPVRVGGGKTLISLLAPYVVESVRPLLLIPAALMDKTSRDFQSLISHWLIPKHQKVISYEMLSRKEQADFLYKYKPDLIVSDEAHKLKNPMAAVTRRVTRYMEDNPSTMFVALSGTMTKRSIKDYAHLTRWCLGRENMPLPANTGEMEEWALALDEKIMSGSRIGPGKLLLFCNEEEKAIAQGEEGKLRAARKAYQRRMADTEGIVTTKENFEGSSIEINEYRVELPSSLEEHFKTLRHDWETPDGWPCNDGMQAYRHGRELGLGFYYKWDPRPPQEWLDRRKAWSAVCRNIISDNRRDIDTEAQVVDALEPRDGYPKGYYPSAFDVFLAWAKIRDTFKPNTVPVWVSDVVIDAAISWMQEKRGIVWTEHVAFGERLSQKSGVAYYGREGRDALGRSIEDAKAGYPLIASVSSNATGRNLQSWNTNLIISFPPNGLQTEQLMGRTHREGQREKVVYFDVLVSCFEHLKAYHQNLRDAKYTEDTMGQAQKILYGKTRMTSLDVLPSAKTQNCEKCQWHGMVY